MADRSACAAAGEGGTPLIRATLLLLASLAGCWLSKQEIADRFRDSDSDEGSGELHIVSVQPPYGTSAGGSEVTIRADGTLEDTVAVYLGDREAEVVSVGGGEIVVETPASSEIGSVDVSLVGASESDVLEHGFQYWEDGTGLTGAYGDFTWWHLQGDYWDSAEDVGYATFGFHQPTSWDFADDYGPGTLDWCENGWSVSPDLDWIATGADEAELLGDGGSRARIPSEEDVFDGGLDAGEWGEDQAWRLEIDGESPFSDLSIDGFVRTPALITLDAPNVDGAVPPFVGPEIDLEWSGPYGADFVVAWVYTTDGYDTVWENITCLLRDDGVHVLQDWMWDDWYAGDTVIIGLGRVELSDAVLQYNHAGVQVAGVSWTFGAAYAD